VTGQIDTDIQFQGAMFMTACMLFTQQWMEQAQAHRAQPAQDGLRGLPKGMRHHAISNGIVSPPPKGPSKTMAQLNRDIDALGLRK